jgi:hypothetical protein
MKQENQDLQAVLTRHLGATKAPPELWQRIHSPRVAARPAPATRGWTQYAALAAVFSVVVAGGWMWNLRHQPAESVETLAVAALNQSLSPDPSSLVTEDAAEVRAWVKQESGIDIPLPPKHSDRVRILGARLSEARVADQFQRVAEVSYQVGEYRAALLVTKDPTGVKTYPSMRGQSYTLASAAPGEFGTACLLCHGTEPGGAMAPAL